MTQLATAASTPPPASRSVHTVNMERELNRLERWSFAASDTSSALAFHPASTPPPPKHKTASDADPGATDNDGGALRAGEVPSLFSRRYVGLVVQYACIGLLYGSLPRTVYPFLNNYLHLNGYQTLSARVLLALPWSFKVFIGIASDCFPLWGSRRRSYMVIGWLLCAAMLAVLALVDQGEPYYVDRTTTGRINEAAPRRGALYIVMMMLASTGYVVSDVAADGLVVEFAQREPVQQRGHIQATVYLVRSLFMIVAALLVGVGLNGVDYGGSFSWSMSMAQLMAVCAVLSLVAIPAAVWLLEEPPSSPTSLRAYLAQLWTLLQNGAMLQVMAYRFFSGIFDGFTVTAGDPIQRYWAHVHPLNESLFSVLGLVVFSAALYFTRQFGLGWNWRVVIASTTLAVVALDSVVALLTVWAVIRSQWFWLGPPVLEELPAAINFLVATFVVVEMAEEGTEAAVYGLLTTSSNLSSPFAACLSKNVNALFDVSVDSIIEDSRRVRWHVTATFAIAYAMKLLALAWLPLLPRQKQETQALKRTAGSSWWGGVAAISLGGFALVWSITTNLLSVFPATACLKVAGGAGCGQ